MNKRTQGAVKEQMICDYLTGNGYRVVDCKLHSGRAGEIDIIALKDNFICFVEVKFRKDSKMGMPEEAVSPNKIKKICRASDYYMLMHKQYYGLQVRFDVAAILGEEIRYYENAFPYMI